VRLRSQVHVIAAALLLLIGPALSPADQVLLKNGTQIIGTILQSPPGKIVIETTGPNPVRYSFNVEDVDKIVRSEAKPESDFDAAKIAFDAKQYDVALEKIVEAMKVPEDARRKTDLLMRICSDRKKAADQLKDEKRYLEAVAIYEKLYAAISTALVEGRPDDEGRILLGELKKFIGQQAAQCYVEATASRSVAETSLLPSAEENLKKAIQYAQPRSELYYRAVLELGKVERRLNKTDEALVHLRQAVDSGFERIAYDARIALQEMNVTVAAPTMPGAPPVTPEPTPRPALTQKPPSVGLYAPPPAPSPTPAASGPLVVQGRDLLPLGKKIIQNIRERGILQSILDLPAKLTQGEYLSYIIPIVLIILIWWVIPVQVFKYISRRGDIFAAQARLQAKKIGLLAVIPYVIKRMKQTGPKNRCPFCGKGIDDIETYSDLNFLVCPNCRENITPVFSIQDYIAHLTKNLEVEYSHGRKGGGDLESITERDAMLKLIRAIITLAVRRRASDLHIEPETDKVKIRARVDGMLHDILSLPKSLSNSIVSAVKVMANLDITERRVPQDGKMNLWVDKADIDIRVASSPAATGEKVSMRLLDSRMIFADSTRLGLEGENLERFERTIRKPHGLILMTGPAGSGKTTTIYVALNTINTGEKNIITIEDPIEYHIKGINQMQVNPAANFLFSTGLRSILRQDPDVILVGEIRDKETAEIAVEAAVTGHLIFSTLHTIDTASAFTRLLDLGIEPSRFAASIVAIIAQRLVRVNCTECRKPYKPKKELLEQIGFPQTAKDVVFMHGSGCDTCLHTGFHGRIGLFEIFMPDESMKEILETNVTSSVIRELARKKGMRTLREEGIKRVIQGLTTVEEVLRVIS
jgi:type II secretory ATPase GspE/PulE/Tfp pilus assembly ATPase PilB-like protein